MRGFRFSASYLRDFAALDSGLTARERESLDRVMAAVVRDPAIRGRVETFYDPGQSSWLLRVDPFVVHYTHDLDADEVIFLNLFRRR